MGFADKTVERIATLIEAAWPGGTRAAAPSLPGAAAALVTLALAELHKDRRRHENKSSRTRTFCALLA